MLDIPAVLKERKSRARPDKNASPKILLLRVTTPAKIRIIRESGKVVIDDSNTPATIKKRIIVPITLRQKQHLDF